MNRIHVKVERTGVGMDEVEAAFARLDDVPGAYLGCDSGIAGLHPLQATLVIAPAVTFAVHADGLVVSGTDACGRALLAHPSLVGMHNLLGRLAGRSPLPALRAFLAAFDAVPEVLLLGALRFEAHRLASTDAAVPGNDSLGVLFFAPSHLQRDSGGQWSRVDLRWDGQVDSHGQASVPVSPAKQLAPQPVDDFPEGGYAEVVAKALDHLRTRPLVSLTLSQSFRRRADVSPAAAFANLRRVNPAPASFFVHADGERLFGASPDLQLVVRDREVTSLPVCGTVARGSGPVGEAESLRELINEDVDAASLAVCSDALRNDLSAVCEPGSLHLADRRRPMSLATVVHTVDRLQGRLRAGKDAWDAIVATAAPVMVTGTPRSHALRSISALEASPRGWYGGLMVRVSADGDALVGTILRAAMLRDGVAEVRTGGDLLADSDPPREERESRHKALSLWRALGIAEEASPANATATESRKQPDAARGISARLVALGDPFESAVLDVLQGSGCVMAGDEAAVTVLTGHDRAACKGWLAARPAHSGLVACGDAATVLLAQAGFTVESIAPEQGRLVRCESTAQAPWSPGGSFYVGRYASLALAGAAVPQGWTVWAQDQQRGPTALVHVASRTACLLWRPDSLLCDVQARQVLQAALAFASQR